MGRALRLLGWFALSAFPLADATARVAAEEHAFQLLRGHLIVVRGSAGAANDLVCLLDTGAGRTILSMAVGNSLGLRASPAVLWSFGRPVEGAEAVVPHLAAGGFQVAAHRVLVADLTGAASAIGLPRLDAIVGVDVLRTRSFSLDFDQRVIRFGEPPRLRHRASFSAHPFLLVLSGHIERRAVRLAVDTGASHLALFETTAAGQPAAAADLTGSTPVVTKTLRLVTIGDWQARGVVAMALQPRAGPDIGIDGIISLATLGARYVQFDFEWHELSWSP